MNTYLSVEPRTLPGIFNVWATSFNGRLFTVDLQQFFPGQGVPLLDSCRPVGYIEFSEYSHALGRVILDEYDPFKFIPLDVADLLRAKDVDAHVLERTARRLLTQKDHFKDGSHIIYINHNNHEDTVLRKVGLEPKKPYSLEEHLKIIQEHLPLLPVTPSNL